jgi:plastocyanin
MPLRLACLLVAAAFAGGVSVAGSAIADDLPVFRLVARDGRFDPAVLEVPAGKRFRVEIVNENRKAIEFESRPLKQEKVIAGGGKATVTINALQAGEYKYFDEFNQATGHGSIVAR